MSKQTHSQDSNFEDLDSIWEEMDEIEPLTPITKFSELDNCIDAYKKAAEHDEYLFGDYDYCKEWVGITTLDV
jgi:hypothetical protein